MRKKISRQKEKERNNNNNDLEELHNESDEPVRETQVQKTIDQVTYKYASWADFKSACEEFDKRNANLRYRRCECCRKCKLGMKIYERTIDMKRYNLCYDCKSFNKRDLDMFQRSLPIWIHETKGIQFSLPDELTDLSEGEKLMIQRYSTFVNVHHLFKGQVGAQGHCCCFKQNIYHVVDILPRLPKDIKFVQVIKKYKNAEGEVGEKKFRIRREKVLVALNWLKKYNKYYNDIIIRDSNLDWMEDREEADLPNDENQTIVVDEDMADVPMEGETVINGHVQRDEGPARSQVISVEEASEETIYRYLGAVRDTFPNDPGKKYDDVIKRVQETAKLLYQQGLETEFPYATTKQKGNPDDVHIISQLSQETVDSSYSQNSSSYPLTDMEKQGIIDYPKVEEKAVDEYDSTADIFPKCMPWLFPGGVGGPFDIRPNQVSMTKWLSNCAFYEDARFVKDKIFPFYALSYVNRHTNTSQGRYYVTKFNNKFSSLKELQESVDTNTCKWIRKLMYFSSSIKGSSSYWRQQRKQIHTWIDHHVAKGKGPPTLFITLSCAEYYWKDIARLLKERFNWRGIKNPLHPPDEDGRINTVRNVNDFTIVVQEYFQRRIKNWLSTVGKKVFMIEHYWLRFEFAPSRGQIHAHMLAITNFNKTIQEAMDACRDRKEMGNFLGKWMEKCFGMTATMPNEEDFIQAHVDILYRDDSETKDDNDQDSSTGNICQQTNEDNNDDRRSPAQPRIRKRKRTNPNHPSNFDFSDERVQQNPKTDVRNLLKALQMHMCNGFCMRKRHKL